MFIVIGAAITGHSFSIRKPFGFRFFSNSIRKSFETLNGNNIFACPRTRLCYANGEADYYRGMDAYQILGVPRTATTQEIKDAYRSLVVKWHPDKHSGNDKNEAEIRVASINRAYYCVGDAERRRNYDMYGDEGVGASAASGMSNGPGFDITELFGGPSSPFGGDIADIFGSIFGGNSRMDREERSTSKG